jgi:hypothetical protein
MMYETNEKATTVQNRWPLSRFVVRQNPEHSHANLKTTQSTMAAEDDDKIIQVK